MKKSLHLIMVSISCLVIYSCNHPVITKSDRNNFLNRYINKFHPDNLSDTLAHINNLDEVFNLKDTALDLSGIDKEFMKKQLVANRAIKLLNKGEFKNAQWLSKDTKSYTILSLPIFSADKNIVVIYRWYWCGSLCAEGGLWVYKFRNGHWEELKLNLERIVS